MVVCLISQCPSLEEGVQSSVRRGGLAMNSIFDQVSTGKGSNRMSEWLKPRKEQPAGIDIAEQRKVPFLGFELATFGLPDMCLVEGRLAQGSCNA